MIVTRFAGNSAVEAGPAIPWPTPAVPVGAAHAVNATNPHHRGQTQPLAVNECNWSLRPQRIAFRNDASEKNPAKAGFSNHTIHVYIINYLTHNFQPSKSVLKIKRGARIPPSHTSKLAALPSCVVTKA